MPMARDWLVMVTAASVQHTARLQIGLQVGAGSEGQAIAVCGRLERAARLPESGYPCLTHKGDLPCVHSKAVLHRVDLACTFEKHGQMAGVWRAVWCSGRLNLRAASREGWPADVMQGAANHAERPCGSNAGKPLLDLPSGC